MTAGRRVEVEAPVEGDVAAAGSEVRIAGPVDGYVMSAGRTVRLDGRIGNDLWAAGETVDVDGEIGNNAVAAGRTIHLRPGAVVGHDAHLAGNTVTTEGRIERNLTIGAATAEIGGNVGGAVEARADRVRVLPGAVIQGDLIVRAPKPPEIASDAKVIGEVRYEKVRAGGGWLSWPWLWLASFGAIVILGVPALALWPAWPRRVARTLRLRFGRSLLAGLAVLLLVPLVVAALAITVVGLPLAAVLFAIYVAVLLLSAVFVAYRIGDWLFDRARWRKGGSWGRLLLGALVVSLGVSAPVIGWLLIPAIVITGAGALVLERRDFRSDLLATGLA
jgi:hypothetical protein